jgi:hypothetical protein
MGDDGEEQANSPAVVSGQALEPRRGPDGRLLPGGPSLHPSGRSKAERDIVELARQRGPEVIKRLFYIAMRGSITNPTTVLAAKLLLERGYGKAPITIGDGKGNTVEVGGIIILPAERSDDDGE